MHAVGRKSKVKKHTRNEWKRCETTLETSGEDVKTTLETSGKDVKTTLETSGEDLKVVLGSF
jgi:hypothetical protein